MTKLDDGGNATPRILRLRGREMVLDRAVAEAFGVETREINQAVARNDQKFTEQHTFQLTEGELDELISRNVIPKPGRGGSRSLPRAFSIKGVARLATIINSAQALRATDLIIDIFTEVWRQVSDGAAQVEVANPSRLLPSADGPRLNKLRAKLIDGLDELLDTVINNKTNTTVRDEIREASLTAWDHLKERMKTRGLENDKLTAETLLILEQVNDLREKRQAELHHASARTESIALDNLSKKMAIVEQMMKMVEKLETPAMLTLFDRQRSGKTQHTSPKAFPKPGISGISDA